jgi:hypothetical protein
VSQRPAFCAGNAGFAHEFQLVDVVSRVPARVCVSDCVCMRGVLSQAVSSARARVYVYTPRHLCLRLRLCVCMCLCLRLCLCLCLCLCG